MTTIAVSGAPAISPDAFGADNYTVGRVVGREDPVTEAGA